MSRLLVTGGAGFIGSYLVEQALQRGYELTVLDALTYAGQRGRVPKAARFLRGDVADPAAVREAMEGVEGVLHLAAETHVDRSIAEPAPFLRTNIVGTQVVLEAARDAGLRLLHVSTDEVYGDREGLAPAGESTAFAPSSPYAASKAAAEHLVFAAVRTWGLRAVVARPCNAYGARQYPEKLVPVLIRTATAGDALPLYGDGLQRRDWVAAPVLAGALLSLWERGEEGRAYNLSGRHERSNRSIAEAICLRLGLPFARIASVHDRPGHDRRYAMTDGPARALGIQLQGDLDAALPELIAAFS